MVDENASEGQQVAFKIGDRVVNKNPASLCHGLVGEFLRYWSDGYTFHGGRACDVHYEGVVDLYGRVEIAQCAADLKLVSE